MPRDRDRRQQGPGRRRGPEGAARRELLAIQMRLWRRLQREIDASIADDPANITIYQDEYERDVRRYAAVASKADLVEAALLADVVYVGDYHTLPQSQRTLVKLLLALTRRREVTLAVEMVHTPHQKHLDRFMAGAMAEGRFLQKIEYERTWGFPWPPYREVLEVAKDRGVRCVAINIDPREAKDDHLLERDFHAARLIVDELEARPGSLVLVFDGDLHVARDHLPMLVDSELRRRKLPPRQRLIVHQNAEQVYWQLAREGREQRVSVVRLDDDSFCVLNASPIEKLHSYLNWVGAREALEPPLGASTWDVWDEDELDEDSFDDELDEDEAAGVHDRGAEYAEQVLAIVTALARFLGVKRDDLEEFELFTVNDLDFLDHLVESGRFTAAEIEDVKRQILSDESYFIPKGDIIYLADFSVANAAEEATHFLHHRCSGYRWDRPRDLVTDFYHRCVTEALGFFGSKVVVPTRECWSERDCARFVEHHKKRERERRDAKAGKKAGKKKKKRAAKTPGGAPSGAEERLQLVHAHGTTLLASRLVLHHRAVERRYLETGEWGSAGRALTQETDVHLAITHMLGHMLGDKLYAALVQGLVPKAKLKELFCAPLDGKGVGLLRYLELVRLTASIDGGQSRGERM